MHTLTLHHGYAAEIDSELGQQLFAKLAEGFLSNHADLKMASFAQEMYLKHPQAEFIAENIGMRWR